MVLRARLKGSGEEVAMPETHVWKLREGKVIEVHEYGTKEAALEAIDKVRSSASMRASSASEKATARRPLA